MQPLTLLITLALAATVVALALGVGSMARGGEFDRTHANRFMVWRVGAQGAALVLLMVALVLEAF